MADFDHITANGTTKYVKDSTARSGLNNKVDKVTGKGLSEEDFTTTLKTKLDSIATGAEVNVQSNWTEADATSDAYIQNKPTIPDDASEIDYDNTVSGLVATDVQAAIDETFATIPTDAVNIDYDNTASGLSATDVQAAIDEIVASGGSDPNKMDKVNPTGTGAFSLNRGTGAQVGDYSTAEGKDCLATQDYAHAEGFMTQAIDESAHAEGNDTVASGARAHAEGLETIASGSNSHAEGLNTKASSANQHVSGQYNVEDTLDTYAEIIGNGTADNARSNARTLDWNGNETLAGDLYFNGGANPLSAQLAAKADKPTLTHYASGNTSVPHDTWTKIAQVSLTKGTYLFHVGAVFTGNATGSRQLSFNATATPGEAARWNTIKIPAGTSAQVSPHMTLFVELAADATWYLHAFQNAGSGTSLEVYPFYQYTKLK